MTTNLTTEIKAATASAIPTIAHPILLDMPMPIVTPRMILRPVGPGDGVGLYEAKLETWEDIHRWMPWAHERGMPGDDEITARKAYAKFILREDFMIIGCDPETNKPLVFTGLHRFDMDIRRFEIGYWCRKSAQGKGYVTEAANALTRYAFAVLNARAVAIDIADGNERSIAVATRLGFAPEGRAKFDMKTPEGICDRLFFSRTNIEGLPPLDVRWGET